MPRTYVALDLETTGLNPERGDAIIEVGAVRFRDGEPAEEFTTLVNPGRPIPHEITQLTGIRDADVAQQPRFSQVAGQLMRFVGPAAIVGHNVGFDLGFLRAQGLFGDNPALDTWELATVLMPYQPGYSLGALAGHFGVASDTVHRALPDALATGRLFACLFDVAAHLPRPILLEIARLLPKSDWPLARVFSEVLPAAGIARLASQPLELEQLAPECPLLQPLPSAEPLAPRENPAPVEVAELAAMLQPGGAVANVYTTYEYRAPQVAMLEAVAGAFNQQHHLLAEAGTGTGKSLAYLLPAIAYAAKNRTRVVISTNTINLQDQLYKKDIPDLRRALGAAWDRETPFRAALLKGRSNYLCLRRFNALKNRPKLSHDELRGIVRILVWLPTTQTGDQAEISLPTAADRFVWSQVAADNEGCSIERCQREQAGRCFFYRARKQADAAHVIVVNHSLLMADAAAENHVLPEYHHLIVDEAHHLENAVTDQLSFKADAYALAQNFATLYSPANKGTGLLPDVWALLRRGVPPDLLTVIHDQIGRVQHSVEAVRERLDDFWTVIADVMRNSQVKPDNGEYDMRLRITDGLRSQPLWVEVEVSWENLGNAWQKVVRELMALTGGLEDLQDAGLAPEGLGSLVEALEGAGQRLEALHDDMQTWAIRPDRNGIYWVEIGANDGRVGLRSAPLHVGPLVQEHILFHSDTVILTSATLRTAGTFDYVRDRLMAQEADTITVGSPFDYESSTLLYLPTDLPEPNSPGFQNSVERTVLNLARRLNGRTLALFTSYAQLRRTAQAITGPLAEAKVNVLSQGSGASRHQLLEIFKTGSSNVLLGTRSFWEGVDVIGPALSALVLVRLPFAVPSDPVIAARSETFDDPFYHYQVPDAILRFRQGFGRLIRSKADRGVVVVLDKRITSKAYGQLFLESLPECTVQRGPLADLPAKAKEWVDGASFATTATI